MSGEMCEKTKHSGDVSDSWKIDNDLYMYLSLHIILRMA